MHVWRSVVFDSAIFGKGADARVGDDQEFAISRAEERESVAP